MAKFDIAFKNMIKTLLEEGERKTDRTGTGTISYPGMTFRHDMRDGFPQVTFRKAPFKAAAVELEGFIKGITSKKWYEERGCYYWSAWCSPQKVKYGHDEETKKRMRQEDDLGLIYGSQGRDFHCPGYIRSRGVDQFKVLIDTLKNDPSSRRMVVSYWNPLALEHQALPACHTQYIVNVSGERLHLTYTMRSCDALVGSNLNSYGLLLHLLAKEAGLKEGVLSAVYADFHCYLNQEEIAKRIIDLPDFDAPSVETNKFTSIFDWTHKDTKLVNYQHGPKLEIPIAV